MSPYDVLIVGGGPAGLSAALTLVRQHHTVAVFDTNESRALPSLQLHGYSGAESKSPLDHIEALRREIEVYPGYTAINLEVVKLAKGDDGFHAITSDGQSYSGKKILLASGVVSQFPDVDGYAECWGKGMHCGVLAMDLMTMPQFSYHLSHLGYQLANNVTIYTNGNDDLEITLQSTLKWKPWATDNRKIKKIRRANKSEEDSTVEIEFEDGDKKEESFIGHAPISLIRGPWAEQLGIEVSSSSGEFVTNGPFQETNVKGVYAAGDVNTMFKVWSHAVYSGAQAAAGIAVRLQEEKWGLASVFG